jgi:hypothetical protein
MPHFPPLKQSRSGQKASIFSRDYISGVRICRKIPRGWGSIFRSVAMDAWIETTKVRRDLVGNLSWNRK